MEGSDWGPLKRVLMRVAVLAPLILFLIGLLLVLNRISRSTAELAGLVVLVIAIGAAWQAIWDPELRPNPFGLAGKVSLGAAAILIAVFAGFLHYLFVAGWCGDFDDGPVGPQTGYCHSGGDFFLSFIPGLLFVAGAALAVRAKTSFGAFSALLLGFGGGATFAVLVPFVIISRG